MIMMMNYGRLQDLILLLKIPNDIQPEKGSPVLLKGEMYFYSGQKLKFQ